jgi:hypothetical protein
MHTEHSNLGFKVLSLWFYITLPTHSLWVFHGPRPLLLFLDVCLKSLSGLVLNLLPVDWYWLLFRVPLHVLKIPAWKPNRKLGDCWLLSVQTYLPDSSLFWHYALNRWFFFIFGKQFSHVKTFWLLVPFLPLVRRITLLLPVRRICVCFKNWPVKIECERACCIGYCPGTDH